MTVAPYLYRRTGAGIASSRNRSSSGSTAKTACTTASATRRNRRAAGASNGSLPNRRSTGGETGAPVISALPPLGGGRWGRLLAAIDDDRGVEVVAGVVAARGAQPHTGVNVLERTSFPLMLAKDFEILRAVVDGQLDVLPVTGPNRDHVAADALDFPGEMSPADTNPLRVEFAIARFEANGDVAVDFDLRPTRLLVTTLDHHGGIGPEEGFAALRILDSQLCRSDRGDRPAEHVLRRRPQCLRRAGRCGRRCRHGARGEHARQNARRRDSCEYLADHF